MLKARIPSSMMTGRPPPAPLAASFLDRDHQAAPDDVLEAPEVPRRHDAARPLDELDVLLADHRADRHGAHRHHDLRLGTLDGHERRRLLAKVAERDDRRDAAGSKGEQEKQEGAGSSGHLGFVTRTAS
jgi:hypothetical protein